MRTEALVLSVLVAGAASHEPRSTSAVESATLSASKARTVLTPGSGCGMAASITPASGGGKFVARTELGKRLWEARQRVVSKGEGLRPANELLAELAQSRA